MNRRKRFRVGLHPLYLPIYDALCAQLADEWQPFFGLRTFEQQDTLYAQGRSVPGAVVTDARGGESAHNYGCASDWTFFENGNPVWLPINDPHWKTYEAACEKAKARWGGTFPKPDYFHNELPIEVRWPKVFEAFQSGSWESADQVIRKAVVT